MKKKIGRFYYDLYPVSKCNLKNTEKITVYPAKSDWNVCLLCGGNLCRKYCLAVQISEDECIKLYGSVCYRCNALFVRNNPIIKWLKAHDFNNSLRVNEAYNYQFDNKKAKAIFYSDESIFRLFVVACKHNVKYVAVTYDKNIERKEELILHYSDYFANCLLKAEKDNRKSVAFNGKEYVIVRIYKKDIPDSEIKDSVFNAVENQIVFNSDIPAFSSDNIMYVYRGNICCHRIHHLAEVRVSLKADEKKYKYYAEYCYECNKFLIKYSDYESYLRAFKLFPGKVKMLHNDDFEMAEYSPLMLNGYSTKQELGLSKAERQKILAFVINHGILAKRQVLDYIERFIKMHKNNKKDEEPVRKWKEDKQFVLDFSEREVPLVIVGEIEKLDRRKL